MEYVRVTSLELRRHPERSSQLSFRVERPGIFLRTLFVRRARRPSQIVILSGATRLFPPHVVRAPCSPSPPIVIPGGASRPFPAYVVCAPSSASPRIVILSRATR